MLPSTELLNADKVIHLKDLTEKKDSFINQNSATGSRKKILTKSCCIASEVLKYNLLYSFTLIVLFLKPESTRL